MAAVIVWPTALKRRLLAGRSSSSIYPGPLLPFAVFPLPFFFLPSIVSLLAEAMENAAISLFRDAHVLNPPALISVLLARVDSSAALQELSVLQTKTSCSTHMPSGLKLSGMTIEMDVSAGQYTEQQGAKETFRDVFLSPGAWWAVPHLRVFKSW
ncbi:hypothetical protein ROHU_024621 [Labeo rohita]|uniref:Uncharacterized protein n=1 Tax=Labeo rohita TaxID=84645 RepID=A0A498MHX6_LABRO|nr:hypothetical protein ROHU_024621 [Labeo rohita]